MTFEQNPPFPDDDLYHACREYVRLVQWANDADLPDNSVGLLEYATKEYHAEQRIREALADRDKEVA